MICFSIQVIIQAYVYSKRFGKTETPSDTISPLNVFPSKENVKKQVIDILSIYWNYLENVCWRGSGVCDSLELARLRHCQDLQWQVRAHITSLASG